MEEAVSGVKGQLATKIYGDDLRVLEEKGQEIVNIMRHIKGIKDLGLFRVVGQPNLNFVVDRAAGGPLPDQRRRRAGRHPDGRGRQRPHPGAPGRAALRPRHALPARLPRHEGGPREDPPPQSFRRKGLPCPALQGGDEGRRGADIPRGEQALRGGQVQRQGPRPRQHRRRGDGEGGQAGEAAAGVYHKLDGRVREPEAGRERACSSSCP